VLLFSSSACTVPFEVNRVLKDNYSLWDWSISASVSNLVSVTNVKPLMTADMFFMSTSKLPRSWTHSGYSLHHAAFIYIDVPSAMISQSCQRHERWWQSSKTDVHILMIRLSDTRENFFTPYSTLSPLIWSICTLVGYSQKNSTDLRILVFVQPNLKG
jgi:hypothetical protein